MRMPARNTSLSVGRILRARGTWANRSVTSVTVAGAARSHRLGLGRPRDEWRGLARAPVPCYPASVEHTLPAWLLALRTR